MDKNDLNWVEKKSITITPINNDDENYIKINISNDGPSIPDNIFPKIFGPLFTTKQLGAGLGLSGAKNSIKQHGGTISVKNNPIIFILLISKIQIDHVTQNE